MTSISKALCIIAAQLSAGAWAEDASALVQSTVQAHHQSASTHSALSRARMAAQIATGQLPAGFSAKFECDKFPLLCRPPFNCENFTMTEVLKLPLQGIAPDGKANLRLWCAAPHYEKYIDMCLVQKDLAEAGRIQFDWSMRQHNGVDELDGSYCFMEGHCTNKAVTNVTTLEDSYKMCDERYGHNAWTKMGSLPTIFDLSKVSNIGNAYGGFHDPAITKVFLKAACGMGNYHCDVAYCQETYCKKQYYIEKYSHLQPVAPGHLLQQRDWLD